MDKGWTNSKQTVAEAMGPITEHQVQATSNLLIVETYIMNKTPPSKV